MTQLSRRQWLRTTGIAAGSLPLLGLNAKAPSFDAFLKSLHHLPPGISAKLNANENPSTGQKCGVF